MTNGHGDDIYHYGKIETNFSSNIYNGFDHTKLFEHLASKLHCITNYPEPTPTRLEKRIAEAIGVAPQNVMATNGATEAIYLVAQAFRDETSAIVQPTFAEYADACRINGHRIRNVSSLDEAFAQNGHAEAPKLVWLCNPNNPTGEVTDSNKIEELARRHNETIFMVDESYLNYSGKRLVSLRQTSRLPNRLGLFSMTKDFGIPGLRLGYLTGSDTLLQRIKKLRMPWAVNQLAIEAGLYLLDHKDDYRFDAAALWREARRVGEKLQKIGIDVRPTDCNILLCRLPIGDAHSLKEWLARERGMLIRDASNFEGLGHGHFRIAVQSAAENDKLVSALQEWLKNIEKQ